MISISRRLGDWVSGFRLDDAPPRALIEAKRCILDVTGVALAGTREKISLTAVKLAFEEMGAGTCTVLGSASRVAATGASYANAVAAHALDFDDTCYDGIVHGSAVVWPAVLAAAEKIDASGAEALAGFIAGVEAEYAIGRAIGDRTYWSGWWNTALLGTIGAAAGASRVLRLGAEETANAIRLAASQPTGLRQVFGTTAKPHICGLAAQKGVWATIAARSGVVGPNLVFEGDRGLRKVLVLDETQMLALHQEVGRRFVLGEGGVAFKLFPVCSAAQAAMEATSELMAEYELDEPSVERVVCEVTPLVAISLVHRYPDSVGEAQFSMPFGIAAILLTRGLHPDSLSQATIRDERWRAAMAKVDMLCADDLVATPEQRRDHPEGAVVKIRTRDGREFVRHKGAATGMPANPMSDEQLAAKFSLCAGRSVRSRHVYALRQRIQTFDELPSARTLFDQTAWADQSASMS